MYRIGTVFGNEVVGEVIESNYSNLLPILKHERLKFSNKLIK
jgi:hypothetical protein